MGSFLPERGALLCAQAGSRPRKGTRGQESYHAALLAPQPLTDERQGVFLTDQLLLSTDPGTL